MKHKLATVKRLKADVSSVSPSPERKTQLTKVPNFLTRGAPLCGLRPQRSSADNKFRRKCKTHNGYQRVGNTTASLTKVERS